MFDLKTQIEEVFEPYWANNLEECDIELLKKLLYWYLASSCSIANLQLSLKTMQHSSSEMQSVVTLVKQIFTLTFPSER